MKRLIIGAFLLLAGGGIMATEPITLLVDDFTNPTGFSALGTQWQGFSDQVMGGKSELQVKVISGDLPPYLSMTGSVSLKNNGGFIQVRLMLDPDEKAFDARNFQGIELEVKGNGQEYFVFLRTKDTLFPWSYYAQGFKTTDSWTRVKLPFSDFEKESILRGLNLKKLTSLAVVATKKEFQAELLVRAVGFY